MEPSAGSGNSCSRPQCHYCYCVANTVRAIVPKILDKSRKWNQCLSLWNALSVVVFVVVRADTHAMSGAVKNPTRSKTASNPNASWNSSRAIRQMSSCGGGDSNSHLLLLLQCYSFFSRRYCGGDQCSCGCCWEDHGAIITRPTTRRLRPGA